MSNSPLVSYTKLSPTTYGIRTHKIDTITIHCIAGSMTVESAGNWFARKSTRASCNYVIGSDGRIGLIVSEAMASCCSSNRANDERAVTIEVSNDGGAPDWHVSDKCVAALISLVTDICKRNNIKELKWQGNKNLIGQVDKQNLTVHRWFAPKACPGDYLYNLHPKIVAEVNTRLKGSNFLNDTEKFDSMMKQWLANQANEPGSPWHEKAGDHKWALDNKVVKGNGVSNGWKGFVTKEQVVAMIRRTLQKG